MGQDLWDIQYGTYKDSLLEHTVCPRSLGPFYIITYYKNGSRLLGHTVYCISVLMYVVCVLWKYIACILDAGKFKKNRSCLVSKIFYWVRQRKPFETYVTKTLHVVLILGPKVLYKRVCHSVTQSLTLFSFALYCVSRK